MPHTEQNDTRGSVWGLREQRKPLTSPCDGGAGEPGRPAAGFDPATGRGGRRASCTFEPWMRSDTRGGRSTGAGASGGGGGGAACGEGAGGTGACTGGHGGEAAGRTGPTDDGGPTGNAAAGAGSPGPAGG